MRKIVLTLSILFISCCLLAQHSITIDGINIDLDKIPFNKAYKIPLNKQAKQIELEKNVINKKVFASDNKGFIAIANQYSYSLDFNGEDKYSGDIKIYNNKGELQWEHKEKSHYIVNCYIDNNAEIVHAVWYLDSDIPDYYELKSYNKTGKQIFKYNTSAICSSSDKKNIFFLDANEYPKVKLAYKNLKSGDSWVKTFNDNVKSMHDVSIDGKRLLFGIDKLYCINELGNIIWENVDSYYASISDNGEKVLNLMRPGQLQLSLIENKSILFEKNSFTQINPKFKPNKCTFIKNSDDYFALSGMIGSLKTLVVVFDNTNEIIEEIIIEGKRLTRELEVIQSGSVTDVYFDGLKVYSF